jgi:hypothetical protein
MDQARQLATNRESITVTKGNCSGRKIVEILKPIPIKIQRNTTKKISNT